MAKRQAAIQNTTIIPGRSIGPIRLGMGMDEVASVLGQADVNYSDSEGASSWTVWKYISINLEITFNRGAAPTVRSVSAYAWTHASRMGDIYWGKNVTAPVVNWSTPSGVTLGSTSFAAVRAYGGSKYEDNTVWMTFKELGLVLYVSVDHMVYGIVVMAPQLF